MKCRDADQWMDLALDAGRDGAVPGSLPAHARGELEAHLDACPHCRRQWEALRTAELALRAPRPVAAPEGLLNDFRRRLAVEDEVRTQRSDRHGRSIAGSFWSWLFPIASVAAGVTAALVVSLHVPRVMAPSREPNGTSELWGTARGKQPAPSAPAGRGTKSAFASGNRGAIGPDAGGFANEHAYPIAPPSLGLPRPSSAATSASAGTGTGLHATLDFAPMGDQPKMRLRANEMQSDRMASSGRRDAGTRPRFAETPGTARKPASLLREQLAEKESSLALALPQAQYGPEAPELSVSPALLVALRRPVALTVREISLGQAVRDVSEAADVAIALDSPGQGQPVLIEAQNQPLWQVLERIARVEHLGIYPEENRLVLRAAPQHERMEAQAKNRANDRSRSRESRLLRSFASNLQAPAAPPPAGLAGPAGPAGSGGPKRPAEPSGLSVSAGRPAGTPVAAPTPLGAESTLAKSAKRDVSRKKLTPPVAAGRANAPTQGEPLFRGGVLTAPAGTVNNRLEAVGKPLQYAAKPAPDRTIWPAAWGTLPERGFQVPTPEELAPIPPNVAASAENSAPKLYYPLRNGQSSPQGQSAPGGPAPAASQNGGNRQY